MLKKVSLCRFFLADQKIAEFVEKRKCVLGHPVARATSYIGCCQTHSDYRPPKMPLKLAV